jgi:hypothetical protein
MVASSMDDTGPVPTRLIFSIIVKVGTGPLFFVPNLSGCLVVRHCYSYVVTIYFRKIVMETLHVTAKYGILVSVEGDFSPVFRLLSGNIVTLPDKREDLHQKGRVLWVYWQYF